MITGIIIGMLIMSILHIEINNKETNYYPTSLWLWCILWILVRMLGEEIYD